MSSSAALEVASGTVFKSLGAMDVSLTEIALLGKRVENELIGVNSVSYTHLTLPTSDLV